jgi:hypothetical protein
MVVYEEILNRQYSYKRLETLIQNKEDKSYNGFMSRNTVSHVKKILTTWTNSIYRFADTSKHIRVQKKPYLTFVTLTLPSKQKDSDNVIKRRVFTPFIQEIIRSYGVQYYFWRAEPQLNGNIHFHLIIDSYIHWKQLRDLWNKHVDTLGYIDNFEKEHKHRDPNSTDIHKLQKIKNVAAYVCKYVTKDEGCRKIDGRIWGCSTELHNCKPYSKIFHNSEYDLLYKFRKNGIGKEIKKDECHVFCGDIYKFLKNHYPSLYREVLTYHSKIYSDLYCKDDLFKIVIPVINVSPSLNILDINNDTQQKLQFY